MRPVPRLSEFVLSLAVFLAPNLFAERWNVQYFFDQDREQLNLVDLACLTPTRGIAVGLIEATTQDKKPRPIALVTSDGGAHWAQVPLKEQPRSLFFLNDSTGWMVTENGLWLTEESGRSWRKVSEQRKPDKKLPLAPSGGLIQRVWFLDEQHGFAIGYQKAVLETHDGGRTWTSVEEAAKPTGNPAFTAYSQIVFSGSLGLIAGASIPPRREMYPRWMEPERAAQRRQQPSLTVELETSDRGVKWQSQTAPVFGVVTALRLAGTTGLSIVSYQDTFEVPSEVYRVDLSTGKSATAFKAKNRRVTDAAVFAGPRGFLAAVEPPGRMSNLPIPGKVKMLTSTDLNTWTEMDVDYRAVATNLILSGPDPDHVWAATDTGMILKLAK